MATNIIGFFTQACNMGCSSMKKFTSTGIRYVFFVGFCMVFCMLSFNNCLHANSHFSGIIIDENVILSEQSIREVVEFSDGEKWAIIGISRDAHTGSGTKRVRIFDDAEGIPDPSIGERSDHYMSVEGNPAVFFVQSVDTHDSVFEERVTLIDQEWRELVEFSDGMKWAIVGISRDPHGTGSGRKNIRIFDSTNGIPDPYIGVRSDHFMSVEGNPAVFFMQLVDAHDTVVQEDVVLFDQEWGELVEFSDGSKWAIFGISREAHATGSGTKHVRIFDSSEGIPDPEVGVRSDYFMSVQGNPAVFYVDCLTMPDGTGAVNITLEPEVAVASGARWRRDGSQAWRRSGTTECCVPSGNHNLEFFAAELFFTPDNISIHLEPETTIEQDVNYLGHPFSVSFDSQGGSEPDPSVKSVNYYSAYGELPDVQRRGYSFQGWFTEPEEGDGTRVDEETVMDNAGEHSLYAHWSVNEYAVRFDAQAGSVPDPSNVTVTFDAAYGELPTTTRTGHIFKGWFTKRDAGIEITAESIVDIPDDHTLYAQWIAKRYEISFDGQGGPDPVSKLVTFGMPYGHLPRMARVGYTLKGWFADAQGEDPVTAESIVENAEDHPLYAQWTAKRYEVTFNAQGGSAPEQIAVVFGEQYGSLPETTRTGYTFKGWFTEPDAGTEITDESTVAYAANHVLHARWTAEEHTLTVYNGSGGGKYPTGRLVPINAEAPWEQQAFDRWDGDTEHVANPSSAGTTIVMPAADVTVSARYKRFTDTLYALRIKDGVGSGQYEAGRLVNIAANPPGEGKVFAKWTGDTMHLADPDSPSTVATMPASDVSVTATYRDAPPVTSAVHFAPQGGEPEPHGMVVTFGSPYGDLPTIARPGFLFKGWFTQPAGGTMVTAETIVTGTRDHALYAHWIDTYVLTVNNGLGGGTYTSGRVATITADVPEPGQYFREWLGDMGDVASQISPRTTVTMPERDVTVTAAYEARGEETYLLAVRGGAPDGQRHGAGSVVAISAKPPEEGKVFDQWRGGDVERVANVNLPDTVLFMPKADVTIEAVYLDMTEEVRTLTVTSGKGGGRYQPGRMVRIQASQRSGQTFDAWVGDTNFVANVNLPAASVVMPDADIGVEATYRERSETPRTIVIRKDVPDAPSSGPRAEAARALASNTETREFLPGQWVDLETEVLRDGFAFDKWTGQAAYVENVNLPRTRTWMPDHDLTVVAEYREPGTDEYVLAVESGSADPDGPYRQGTEVAITAAPPGDGLVFDQWAGQTGQVADPASAQTTIYMPAFDVEVAATYKEIPDPEAIPTLSEWGMILFAGVILLLGAITIRRQRFENNRLT